MKIFLAAVVAIAVHALADDDGKAWQLYASGGNRSMHDSRLTAEAR